ncbi:alpha/beta hydrolase fold domain-containing protein [Roseomonas arctica]|uniref:Alpha/beta hydrolase fold domain-containing protein n=2 Tax=Plastoroseomonas arctica TaxID=1509237 RepID=A0AAF1K1C8_9PROT|nr:alpha/beta hydrolase fold domain-containing protein [Plastoroseomonas arctica]
MLEVCLFLDAYLPDAAPNSVGPALILAFGGAFHRGSKEDDTIARPGVTNTAMAEYCRRFAAQGIACFSVDYRLAPADPDPGDTPVLTEPDGVPTGRIAEVREIMGLAPITAREVSWAMEAAIDDVAAAIRWVHREADRFSVDPKRIVVGGWSAGARAALYAAYGEGVACAGVIALSGTIQEADLKAHLRPGRRLPPALLIAAEHDLSYVPAGVEGTASAIRRADGQARAVHVPGHDHWYPAEAMTSAGLTVEATMLDALRGWTR